MGLMQPHDRPIGRDDQVKIDENAVSSTPGSKLVDIDPTFSADPAQRRNDLFEQHRIGAIHEPQNRFTDEFIAGPQDIETHDDRHDRVEPGDFRDPNKSHADHNSETRISVREYMLAISSQNKRVALFPDANQPKTEK